MTWLRRVGFLVFGIFTLVAAYFSWIHLTDRHPGIAKAEGGPTNFDGTFLAAADMDQQYGAYADGVLDQIPGAMDSVSVLSPALSTTAPVSKVLATHAVVGWPQIIDVSPDGRFAYVAETRGKPEPGLSKVDDVYSALPPGQYLTTIDLLDLGAPIVAEQRKLGQDLTSISASKDGRWLAVSSLKQLIIVELLDGKPGRSYAFDIETDPDVASPRPGANAVAWHPDSRHLALNISNRQIAFFRFDQSGGVYTLDPVGKRLTLGETFSAGQFHPSGKYFLVTDIQWGNQRSIDYLFNDYGLLFSIKFSKDGQHSVADKLEVGRSPEGFAISALGDRIVTVDMNRTFLPDIAIAGLFPGSTTNALSLIAFDASSGALELLDQKGFAGNLPEDAIFDEDGNALAVAIYEYKDRGDRKGYVSYWRIENDTLVPTGIETPVDRGVHDLVLLPPVSQTSIAR